MRIGIALGSNLGDRLANLRFGRDELLNQADAQLVAQGGVYETDPVDCPPGSEPFYNSVLEIETELSARELLDVTQSIERKCGRMAQSIRNAPRPLDLDLLYAEDVILDQEDLKLPHPRIHERLFVLAPLADIRPSLRLPGQTGTVLELWTEQKGQSLESPPRLCCQLW